MANMDKMTARRAALDARAVAHKGGFDVAANTHLLDYLRGAVAAGACIAGYMPIRTEVSPMATLDALDELGFALCLPVVIGKDRPLAFHSWRFGGALVDGAFGAAVPAKGADVSPDIVITPMVGFDKRGYRLGYGGGFYDRSFAGMERVVVVGFAYSAQEVPRVDEDATDVKMDVLVTENGVVDFSD